MGMVLVRCLVPLRLRDDLRAACFHSSDAALKVDTQIVKTNKKKSVYNFIRIWETPCLM